MARRSQYRVRFPARISFLALLVACGAADTRCHGGTDSEVRTMSKTRPSVLAGMWYSSDPGTLAAAVDDHVARGEPLGALARNVPVAAIAPHAGHQWSGDAAGHVYRLISGPEGESITRVILIGPSHHVGFRGASVATYTAYETPLGCVPVDTVAVRALLASPLFQSIDRAHGQEHCLEIQVPFLQRALRHPFRIVPLLISSLPRAEWETIAAALVPLVDDHTLVLISSDFTHFGRNYGYYPFRDNLDLNLRRLDKGALEPILRLDYAGLADYVDATDISVCGYQPIGILLAMLRDPDLTARWGGRVPQGRVLDYYRSGDRSGDLDGSVSYAAVAFFRAGDLAAGAPYPASLASVHAWEGPNPAGGEGRPAGGQRGASRADAAATSVPEFTAAERRFLLDLARRTVEETVRQGRPPNPGPFPPGVSVAKLQSRCGVFVTLTEQEQLRGCIGSIVGTAPLIDGVMENAVNAATRDPRFPPVSPVELAGLSIEISVLTPLRRVAGPAEIEVGRHGVVLERAGRRAVFLPQVATEQHWDRDTLLDHLALKAGLRAGDWRKPDAVLQVFEALVFSEDEHDR